MAVAGTEDLHNVGYAVACAGVAIGRKFQTLTSLLASRALVGVHFTETMSQTVNNNNTDHAHIFD